MSIKFYSNFELALNRLRGFINQGIKDDLDRAGVIQAFEFTFEQAWKAIQKKGKNEGVEINSPKQAFTWAMGQKWISVNDELMWLDLLNDRNLTTHAYREDVAKKVAQRTETVYAKAFFSLLEKMKKE